MIWADLCVIRRFYLMQNIGHYSEFFSLRIDTAFSIYGNADLSLFNITYCQMIGMCVWKIYFS